jgi:hypothetical protein
MTKTKKDTRKVQTVVSNKTKQKTALLFKSVRNTAPENPSPGGSVNLRASDFFLRGAVNAAMALDRSCFSFSSASCRGCAQRSIKEKVSVRNFVRCGLNKACEIQHAINRCKYTSVSDEDIVKDGGDSMRGQYDVQRLITEAVGGEMVNQSITCLLCSSRALRAASSPPRARASFFSLSSFSSRACSATRVLHLS